MKSFVEKTKAKMGDLQSQVTTGVTRMRGQLGRSFDDMGSELGTPVSSEMNTMDGGRSEDQVAKLEAQNQVLWAKAKTAIALEEENDQLRSAKNNLVMEIRDAQEHIKVEQDASSALKEKLREMVKDQSSVRNENAELRAKMEELQYQVVMSQQALESETHSRTAQEQIVETLRSANQSMSIELHDKKINEDRLSKELDDLRSELHTAQNKLCPSELKESNMESEHYNESHVRGDSRDIDHIAHLNDTRQELRESLSQSSQLQALANGLMLQVKDLENEQRNLCARNTFLEEQLCNFQRELTESEESRSYLNSIVEDLQKQVDTCSTEQVIGLRGMVQNLERDNNLLQADVEILSLQLRGASNLSSRVESNPPVHDVSCDDSMGSGIPEEDSGVASRGPPSEPLVDLSKDIVTEMANLASHSAVPVTLSSIQYAGLLSIVQNAVQQLEDGENSRRSQSDTFTMLDQILSRSLSITKSRDLPLGTEIHDQLCLINHLLEERQNELVFMQEIFDKLKHQSKNQMVLSLPQEVQIQFLLQRTSSQEKVIKLSWEVEGLCRDLEEATRKLDVLQEQSEQQQHELEIQWESKQQALAETQAHHSQVSTVSQQVDHLREINENIQSERLELERELDDAREELESLQVELERVQGYNGGRTIDTQASTLLPYRNVKSLLGGVDEQIKEARECLCEVEVSMDDVRYTAQDIKADVVDVVNQLKSWEVEKEEMLEEIENLQADVELSASVRLKLEASIRNLQGEVLAAGTAMQEMKGSHRIELQGLYDKLQSTEAAAAAEIMSLQDIQTSLQGSLHRTNHHVQELTEQLEESEKDKLMVTDALNASILEHEVVHQDAQTSLRELELERDSITADLQAWKFKATDLGDAADETDRLQKENEQLIEQLSLKEAMWESERRKFNELSVEKTRIHKEVSSMELMIDRLEDNLCASKGEVARLKDVISAERQQYTAAARAWEEELEALPGLTIPRGSWPAPVTRLVEQCEQLAEAHVRESEALDRHELLQQLEKARERIEVAETRSAQEIERLESERASTRHQLTQLEGEMKERERAVQEKLLAFEEMEAKTRKQEIELTSLRRSMLEVTGAHDESKVAVSRLTSELEETSKELGMVQDKTRNMMVEKDNEIARLKALQRIRSLTSEIRPAHDQGQPIFDACAMDYVPGVSHGNTSGSMDQTNPHIPMDSAEIRQNSESCAQELRVAQEQVRKLEMDLQESDRTHALRDKAHAILKEEIADLQRGINREGVDVDYLKNILVAAFEQGTLPNESPMLDVLARLLHFSPKELERIKNALPGHARRSSKGLFPFWGQ